MTAMIHRFRNSTDDALRSAIERTDPGDTLAFPAEATIDLGDTWLDFEHIGVLGRGSTVHQTKISNDAIVNVGDGAKVEGLTVRGSKPPEQEYDEDWEANHGFAIRGAERAIVSKCMSRDVRGDGYYFGHVDSPGSRDVTLCASKAWETGRSAISIVAGEDIKIGGFHALGGIGRTLINFENHPKKPLRNITIIGVLAGWHRLNTLTFTGHDAVEDVTIDGLTLHPSKILQIACYGHSDHGARRRITLRNFAGGAHPASETKGKMHRDDAALPGDRFCRFHTVEGLELWNFMRQVDGGVYPIQAKPKPYMLDGEPQKRTA